jgi:transposase-like protein
MRLFKRLRLAHGSEAAQQAYDELHQWLGKRHQGAQQSLTDAKERLLVVHSMELGEEHQRSLLSTNAIENVMRNKGTCPVRGVCPVRVAGSAAHGVE